MSAIARVSRQVSVGKISPQSPPLSPSSQLRRSKSRCERYTQPTVIWQVLRETHEKSGEEHVRLVRMSWLLKQFRKSDRSGNYKLPRRQDLPEEAFVNVDDLEEMYDDFGAKSADLVLPIIAISYCWLTPDHPDPRGDQLATVATALQREMHHFTNFGYEEMGVFWDWMSLHQRDNKLWEPFMYREGSDGSLPKKYDTKKHRDKIQKYKTSRKPEHEESIGWALRETMDLWYAHKGTSVFLLTELPTRYSGKRPDYDSSGWTTYERSCAELIKEFDLAYAGWRLVQELDCFSKRGIKQPRKKVSGGRRWPISGADFEKLVREKAFTNGADKDMVAQLYSRLSTELLGSATALGYAKMPTPSVLDGQRLGRCLNLCTSLKVLDVSSVRMSDEASIALCNALDAGALPELEDCHLEDNRIDDEGMRALAAAFRRGAMHRVKDIQLRVHRESADMTARQDDGFNLLTSGLNLSENPGKTRPVWEALGILEES